MAEAPEKLYSSREAASELGLGAAMLRRYASSYEAVSGDAITLHRRDGRLFTEEQLGVLIKARALVMRTSVDVETAIKQALERPLEAAPVALVQSSALGTEVLTAALTAAMYEANGPLLEELRGVRESLERLEAQLPATVQQEPEPTRIDPPGRSEHGPFVRFALWLEGRLRR